MYISWVFEDVRGETVDVVVDLSVSVSQHYPSRSLSRGEGGTYLSNNCVMVAEIRTRNPVPGVRRRVRGSSGWVGGYVGQDLDVGEDGALGVDYLYEVLLDIADGGWSGLEELTLMVYGCGMSALSDFWVYSYVFAGCFGWKKLVMAGMGLFCRQLDMGGLFASAVVFD
jgi:hypothetical protein